MGTSFFRRGKMLASISLPLLLAMVAQGQSADAKPEDAPVLACLHLEACTPKERQLTIKDRVALLQKRGYVIERRGLATLAIAPSIARPPASRILGLAADWISKDGKPTVLDTANLSEGERKAVSDALSRSPFARSFENMPVRMRFKATVTPAAYAVVRMGNREFKVLACDSSDPAEAMNQNWDVNSKLPDTEPTKRMSHQEVLETLGSPLPRQVRDQLLKSLGDFALEKQTEEVEKLSEQLDAKIKSKLTGDGPEPSDDEGSFGQFSPAVQRMLENSFATDAEVNGFDSREDAIRALRSASIHITRWTAQMAITGADGKKSHSYSFTLKTLRY